MCTIILLDKESSRHGHHSHYGIIHYVPTFLPTGLHFVQKWYSQCLNVHIPIHKLYYNQSFEVILTFSRKKKYYLIFHELSTA